MANLLRDRRAAATSTARSTRTGQFFGSTSPEGLLFLAERAASSGTRLAATCSAAGGELVEPDQGLASQGVAVALHVLQPQVPPFDTFPDNADARISAIMGILSLLLHDAPVHPGVRSILMDSSTCQSLITPTTTALPARRTPLQPAPLRAPSRTRRRRSRDRCPVPPNRCFVRFTQFRAKRRGTKLTTYDPSAASLLGGADAVDLVADHRGRVRMLSRGAGRGSAR